MAGRGSLSNRRHLRLSKTYNGAEAIDRLYAINVLPKIGFPLEPSNHGSKSITTRGGGICEDRRPS